MKYIQYLKKSFGIQKIDNKIVQDIYEKPYQTANINILKDTVLSIKDILSRISPESVIVFSKIGIRFNIEFMILFSNNIITQEDMFYILFILCSKTDVKASRKIIKNIIKDLK